MKLQVDDNRFDELQTEVGFAVAHEIYRALKKAGVPDGEQIEEIVADALFHIGCVIDGSHQLEGPDGPMQAVLTFRQDKDDQTLLWAEGTSWIHEGAFQIAGEYFDRLQPGRVRSAQPPVRQAERPRTFLDGFLRMVRDIVDAFTKP